MFIFGFVLSYVPTKWLLGAVRKIAIRSKVQAEFMHSSPRTVLLYSGAFDYRLSSIIISARQKMSRVYFMVGNMSTT